MPIVYGPDGKQFRFPPGTPPEVIERELAKVYAPPSSGAEAAPTPRPFSGADLAQASAHGLFQGATFGFGDEIVAGLKSLIGGGSYRDNLQQMREEMERYRRELPALYGGGEVAGAALTAPFIPGGPLRGSSLLGAAGRGALQGAVAGGLAGAGHAEDDVVGSAARGAVAGSVLGGAIPPATRAAGKVGGMLLDLAPGLRQRLSVLPGVATPEERAAEIVMRDLQRDGLTVGDVDRWIAEARAAGKPAVVADAAGPNVRALADVAAKVPSAGVQYGPGLVDRWREQAARVHDDILALGGRNPNRYATVARLAAEKQFQLAPRYQQLMEQTRGIPVDDADILEILKTPAGRQAYARARRIAANEGITLPSITDAEGNVRTMPNLEVLDYVKRGFDDAIEAGKRGSLGSAEVHSMRTLREKLRDRLDALFPEYAKLRAEWAGKERVRELIEEGAEAVRKNLDPREVQQTIQGLRGNDVVWFRYGMMDELLSNIRSTSESRDIVKVLADNPHKREMLRLMFGDQRKFDQFMRRLGMEQAMGATYSAVMGNSKTAERMARMADMADSGAANWLTPQGLTDRLIRWARGRAAEQNAARVAELTLGEPGPAVQALLQYQDAIRRRGLQRLRLPATTSALAGGLLAQ